jgi:FkbM family methyltransferase
MYSQNNEQQIIERYFKGIPGTFLDIGANDGITLSNTYALTLSGWQGLCVEASPSAFEKLKITHSGNKRIQLIHAAATDYNGEIVLFESGSHLGVGDVALLSSVDKAETVKWKKETFTEITVPAVNFETLMGLSNFKKFDFISIDCEGCEICMLEQMDLRALGCRLLCVEYNSKDQYKYDNIVLPQGYKLLHKNGENLIYETV